MTTPAHQRHHRIIVLGAGFSAPAGVPLSVNLFAEVRRRAETRFGSDNIIEAELARYCEYVERTTGNTAAAESFDYEEFLGFLDVEFTLGFRGSKQDTEEGNGAQVVIKELIGEIIVECTPRSPSAIPQMYKSFASSLCEDDWVLTLNYDTLLEGALQAVGKPYRLFPNRFTEVYPVFGYGKLAEANNEIVVLKLHGSVDWFDRGPYEEAREAVRAVGGEEPHACPHFRPDNPFDLVPLLEGPQMPDDPMRTLYRMQKTGAYFQQAYVPQPPFILPPSSAKAFYASTLKPLWWGIGRAGLWNLGMAIVGYSVPTHDGHVLQALYNLTQNYAHHGNDFAIGEVKRTPLRIVNLARTWEELRRFRLAYRFVDLDRAELWLNGMSEEAVGMLFRRSGT